MAVVGALPVPDSKENQVGGRTLAGLGRGREADDRGCHISAQLVIPRKPIARPCAHRSFDLCRYFVTDVEGTMCPNHFVFMILGHKRNKPQNVTRFWGSGDCCRWRYVKLFSNNLKLLGVQCLQLARKL